MLIGEAAPAADAPPSSSIGSSLSEAMITCEVEGVHKGVAEASQQAARDARARLRYRGLGARGVAADEPRSQLMSRDASPSCGRKIRTN